MSRHPHTVELGAVLAFSITAVINSTMLLLILCYFPMHSIENSMLVLNNYAISNCAMLLLLFLPP